MSQPTMTPAAYIWHGIRYKPLLYTITLTAWILIYWSELTYGLMFREFFNWITGDAVIEWTLPSLLLMVVVAVSVHVSLIIFGIWIDIRHRFTTNTLVWRNLMRHLLQHPGARALLKSPGEALSIFRDDSEVVEDVIDWLIDVIGNITFGILAISIMMAIDARIALLTMLPTIAVVSVNQLASRQLKKIREQSRQATERVTGALGELLSATQAIQVANAEAYVRDYVAELSDERRRLMVRDQLLQQILASFFSNTGALGTALTLIVAANAMRSGSFTVGDFALFVAYLQLIAIFTTRIGNYLATLKQADVSFQRLLNMLRDVKPDTPPETPLAHHPIYYLSEPPALPVIVPQPAPALRVLHVTGLTYHYPNGQGVGPIDLTLNEGEFVVVTGRVGSGKTTLLRALLGLLPSAAVSIRWNGELVAEPAGFFIPPHVAYMPQVPHLFSDTLRNNLQLGLNATEAQLDHAMAQAELSSDLATMPERYETRVGTDGMRLSGGQLQRTAAARMFLRQPALYVIDDLSSAVDVRTEARLWDNVAQTNAACLVVSHRRPALQRADRILLLEAGRLVDSGSLAELRQRSPLMQSLWAAEANGAAASQPSGVTT